MFKKSLQNNKVVRVVAIVLTVAMLMTVCMTEAFAALVPGAEVMPCASGTLQGYGISSSLGRHSQYNKLTCYAVSDVNMGVHVGDDGKIKYQLSNGNYEYRYTNRTVDYYGYDISFAFTVPGVQSGSRALEASNVPVVFGYNGQEATLRTNATFS